jgi:hypothetical protein
LTNALASNWELLFDLALSIIDQANANYTILDHWTFGGGTALMLQIGHRDSFDIDIFIDDPQLLSYLHPQTQNFSLQPMPDDYTSDGTKALKIIFAHIGEIDFICAASLTDEPASFANVRGRLVKLETPTEIIARKICYRGASMQPRDIFDLACVSEVLGEQLVIKSLLPFKTECQIALDVLRRMNSNFASSIMSKLQIREKFEHVAWNAQSVAIELLEAVVLENRSAS